MRNLSTLGILLLTLSSIISAQKSIIPSDFEYLDHREKTSKAEATAITHLGLLYISHNDKGVTVNLAHFNNQVEELYRGPWCASEIFQVNDTTYQVILDRLNEGDIGAPGFVVITLDGTDSIVDDYSYGRANIEESVLDVISAGNDQWWCLGFKKIFLVSDSAIIKEVQLEETYDKLFYDRNDRILMFQSYNEPTIFNYFDGDSIIPYWNNSSQAYDARLFRGFTFVLYDGGLFQYSDDFLTLNNLWRLPDDIKDLNQLHFTEDFITFSSIEEDTSRIIQCDYDENCRTISTEVSSDEKVTAAFHIGDSEFLLGGVSRFKNISEQLFFRYRNLNLPSDYKKSQVSIVSAELTPLKIDSFPESIVGVDTTWYYEQEFEYATIIRNDGMESISLADAYSGHYFLPPMGFNLFYLHSVFDNLIAPQEIVERRDTFKFFPRETFNLEMGIPGADLMFNKSEASVFDILNLSEIKELTTKSYMTVYPNPTSDYITLDTDVTITAFSIYSADGRLITYKQGEFIDKKIAVESYNPGLYYIIIKEKGSQQLLTTQFNKI